MRDEKYALVLAASASKALGVEVGVRQTAYTTEWATETAGFAIGARRADYPAAELLDRIVRHLTPEKARK